MARLYFENALGRILEHADGYAWLHYHAGARNLADVQAFLVHTGRLLQRRGWHKMLSDQRLLKPFTEADQALILDYWRARRVEAGPVTGAVLLSQDVFTRLSFSQIRHQANGVLAYRLFEKEAEATAWLSQQP
ncbi:hypothetical protein [Hymenobacter sp. BT491]|uniref:hypothetical protein n=1 Tax=Hymenobacter sp. BT491 TaxID=2766779 RepID=UPI0016536169|nr:hypothetical protein [Hymenobacter sp. BT491]MBC6988667.1 hypothetical protein [Hymenobacter sp. BT491]